MRLFDLYKFRWLLAVVIGLPIAWIVRAAFTMSPPPGFEQWPYASQRAAAHLVSGTYSIAYGAWLAAVVGAGTWLAPLSIQSRVSRSLPTAFALLSASGFWTLVKACGAISASPPEMLWRVLAAAAWAVVPALLAAVTPVACVEAIGRLMAQDWLVSLVYSGRGAHAAWAAPHTLDPFTEPLPEEL
ncbi:hypothetical protein [Botrimarina mediterranea]|uniref:Uncharacterized protein n=1 Tax=Botrimarina mediterranea TaxID=2528022 RepID=A0A518K280_9BACT|nr:hypothetical protein [Botrimarina mediterranea]QDV71870.1 hypothetical protein Spa11_00390 [Botrimarina mediterranea]